MFFVPKKYTEELRPTTDYRKLNKVTVDNKAPIPLISTILEGLQKATWFTKLDIRWGFNNIRIVEEDRHKAAFITPDGLYQPNVMFFGLKNAPATFQNMMNHLFRDLVRRGVVKVYFDDILIYSHGTREEHEDIVKEVLKILVDNNLYCKLSKCEFSQPSVAYLGVVVGKGQVRMDPIKVKGVTDWPRPSNLLETQKFLGFCNYYRRFVKDFAKIARPLHELQKKDVEFEWKPAHELAFDALKEAITSEPVLTLPKEDAPLRIEADSSDYATGGVISQKLDDGWHPIAFLSSSLDAAERNYTIFDKELLAIMRALKEFSHLFQGAKETIEIWTDHMNLLWGTKPQDVNRRHARWITELSQYDFLLIHKPGAMMTLADTLSRRPDHKEGVDQDNKMVTILPKRFFADPELLAQLESEQINAISGNCWR